MKTNRTRSIRFAMMATAAILVCQTLVQASVVRRVSLDELTTHSSTVVVARCLSQSSRWTASGQIVTTASYDVVDVLKGRPGRRVKVETLGGVVDGIAMVVGGMPTFEPGREEVLFLTASDNDTLRIVGMSQGQFIVSKRGTSKASVHRDLAGVELFGQKDERLEPQSFTTFMQSLRDRIR